VAGSARARGDHRRVAVDRRRRHPEDLCGPGTDSVFTPAFDGLPTFIAPIVGLAAFLVVAYAAKDTYGTRTLDRQGRRTITAAGEEED
jgi:hypothetical protein